MPVEPFEAFPKEFHVRRKTHVAFIACGIGHADVKVIKIRFQCEARGAPWKESMSRRDAISLRMALTILKLVMGRDGGIIIPQKIW